VRNDGFIEAGIGYVVITSYTSGATFGSLDTANSVQIATGCAGGVCQIPQGGTSASTAAGALANLGGFPIFNADNYSSIQAAITAAQAVGGSVLIPQDYARTDAFSNNGFVSIIDLRHGTLGVFTNIMPSYPTVPYPGGEDLVLNTMGPADTWIENLSAYTATTSGLSVGANTNVLVNTVINPLSIPPGPPSYATVVFGNYRQVKQTGTTALFALGSLQIGYGTPSAESLNYDATVGCPTAGTWNVVDATHLCINIVNYHPLSVIDITQGGGSLELAVGLITIDTAENNPANSPHYIPMNFQDRGANSFMHLPTVLKQFGGTWPEGGVQIAAEVTGGYNPQNLNSDFNLRLNNANSQFLIKNDTTDAVLTSDDDAGQFTSNILSAQSYFGTYPRLGSYLAYNQSGGGGEEDLINVSTSGLGLGWGFYFAVPGVAPVKVAQISPTGEITANGGFATTNGTVIPSTALGYQGPAAGYVQIAPTASGAGCLYQDGSGTYSWAGCSGGPGSGTVNSGTTGQIAYYPANGTAVSGETTVPITAGGTGATNAAGANLAITGVTQTGTLGTSSQVSAFPGTVAAGAATPTTIGSNGVLLNGVPALQAQTSLYNYYSGGAGNLTGTGYSNTANGYQALYFNTTGDSNTANGFQALYANTTGFDNAANGYQALYFNTIGSSNTANGMSALYANTGYSNTANGFQALYANTTGFSNTANGVQALYANTTGSYNTANGVSALYANTTGYSNTANGVQALYANTTGNYNTANGFQAGQYIADGVTANQTSSNSVYEGFQAYPLASGDTNENVIGNGAVGNGSNTTTLGNSSVTATYLAGITLPLVIYSHAGTQLAACASGLQGGMAVVSDATALVPGTAYSVTAGAGADTVRVQCTLVSGTYAWQTM
jgi:hypothetical protein